MVVNGDPFKLAHPIPQASPLIAKQQPLRRPVGEIPAHLACRKHTIAIYITDKSAQMIHHDNVMRFARINRVKGYLGLCPVAIGFQCSQAENELVTLLGQRKVT